MSPDDHGYEPARGRGDPGRGGSGDRSGQTRTRLPDYEGASSSAARRSAVGPSRGVVTVVSVVVLLIAAIAFANRGGDDSGSSGKDGGDGPRAAATAASGRKPVSSKSAAGIPSHFAHDQQGAQSAAANYAVALGSAEMFVKEDRDAILAAIVAPSRVRDFEADFDKAYSPQFKKTVGLDEDGSAPKGHTFVSRTTPIGTKTSSYTDDEASVSVWCGGLAGLAGENSTTPVTSSWFTITLKLVWQSGDWKIVSHSQHDGPAPVPGDDRASSADEIAEAVEGYGGFTYAR